MTRQESREWVEKNLPRVSGHAARKFAQSVYKNPDLRKVYKDAYDSIPDVFPNDGPPAPRRRAFRIPIRPKARLL